MAAAIEMSLYLVLFLSLAWRVGGEECSNTNKNCQPEQVHIAFGEKVNDITITWSTLNDTKESIVKFGKSELDSNVTGERKEFVDGGPLQWRQWIHNARLMNLEFNTTYEYIVGSKHGWSEQFSFKTPPAGENWVVRAVVFGDLGVDRQYSLPYIKDDVANGHYDVILHTGDFAYNLDHDNGILGNVFMNSIQPIAARVPYMVCPGNHEVAYNFSHYRNRFSMPGASESMFYSFNMGPIHFVSVNTEAYYNDSFWPGPLPTSNETILTQYNWLVQDLIEANKPENRLKRPWIIMYAHRPMYCSNKWGGDQCRNFEYPHRVGIPELGGFALEPLLKDYGVDLGIWAHEHSYERMWPVYNKTVHNGSLAEPYKNPGAPPQVTSGSAGCSEQTDTFFSDPYDWSAFRSRHYGYARLYVYNNTHLYMEQIATHEPTDYYLGTSDFPQKIDEFWVVREHHGPYII